MSRFYPEPFSSGRKQPASDEIIIALSAGNRVVLSGRRLPRASELRLDGRSRLRIGRIDEAPCALLEVESTTAAPELTAPFRLVEIREALTVLDENEQIALCRARTLSFWRRNRRYCGACGHELEDRTEECARACPACGAVFYPQIAPAVITAVTDEQGRLLLAHNSRFREGVYSLIAGFVEPGESMESAVRREIREEVGLEVKRIRYAGSQSWPYPNSLMIGFTAEYAGGMIRPDGMEITDARFCTPADMPDIPSPGSIARMLIDQWLKQQQETQQE